MNFDLHPCTFGDLPQKLQLIQCLKYLPLSERGIRNHWKSDYSWISREKSGLFVDIRKCDEWLDMRGHPLISLALLQKKKRKNPGWHPICERISFDQIIERLKRIDL